MGADISSPKSGRLRVSIIIPVFNGAAFLGEAIASALAQTYPDCEIIVVDDGSDDGGATERIAKSFGDAIHFIRKPNGGVASALNVGLANMQGDLFSWLSHDDIYTPDKIESEVAAYKKAGGDVIVYTDYFVIDQNGTQLYAHILPDIPQGGVRCFLTESSAMNGATLLIPRAYLQQAGGFDENLKVTQDYDMWFRLAKTHRFIHVDEQLMGMRLHTGQTTATFGNQLIKERDELYCRFLAALDDSEIERYAGHNVPAYYLKLYRQFRIGGLTQATRVVRQRLAALMSHDKHPLSVFVQIAYMACIGVPAAYIRALAKHALLKSDLKWLTATIVRSGRCIGAIASPVRRSSP